MVQDGGSKYKSSKVAIIIILTDFACSVIYKPEKLNVNADVLSRNPVEPILEQGVNMLTRHQKKLEELNEQKFGTPIDSVISPVLAEIVMEDLEKSVFERLGFVVRFYIPYVGDTLLCVPLDKLQTLKILSTTITQEFNLLMKWKKAIELVF